MEDKIVEMLNECFPGENWRCDHVENGYLCFIREDGRLVTCGAGFLSEAGVWSVFGTIAYFILRGQNVK